jgi:hypothetical protein
MQPTKTVMIRQLTAIRDAADLLDIALRDPMTRAFLERDCGVDIDNKFSGLQDALQFIAVQAHNSARSPLLTTKGGKAKSGRGKAQLPGTYSPKIFCAVVIAEAWKFLHGKYPASVSKKAAEAAEAYWLVSGGATAGWGNDRLGAWRPYFEKARRPEVANERAKCLRILSILGRNEE